MKKVICLAMLLISASTQAAYFDTVGNWIYQVETDPLTDVESYYSITQVKVNTLQTAALVVACRGDRKIKVGYTTGKVNFGDEDNQVAIRFGKDKPMVLPAKSSGIYFFLLPTDEQLETILDNLRTFSQVVLRADNKVDTTGVFQLNGSSTQIGRLIAHCR